MSAPFIIVKSTATDDVRDITEFIAMDSEQSAERFRAEFKAAIERLRSFPEIGHRAKPPNRDLRLMRVSSRFRRYLIVYRVLGDTSVSVIRVIHGAMNIRAQLAKTDLT